METSSPDTNHPTPLKLEQGKVLLREGNIREALTLFQQSVAENPDDMDSHITYGKALCDLGDIGNGLMYLQRACSINPNNWTAHTHYGAVMEQTSRFEDAVKAYEKAYALAPTDLSIRQNLSRVLSRFVPPWHLDMLADRERNEKFEAAIAETVYSDSVVLDIGTGSGLLSLMAVKHGAKRVYTCEQSPYIAEAANEIIAKNGASNKIHLFNCHSTALTAAHLPEPANVLIGEIFDAGLIGEHVVPSFRHALSELCTADCRVIPAHGLIHGRLIHAPELACSNPIGDVLGFDLSAFDKFRVPKDYLSKSLSTIRHVFLSDTFPMLSLDFNNLGSPIDHSRPVTQKLTIPIIHSALAHGVAFWFELELSNSARLSSDPERLDNHWGQAIYFFDEPKAVEAHNSLEINLKYDDTHIWFS